MPAVRIDHVDEGFFVGLRTIHWEQNVKWKAGLEIFVALALIFAGQSRLGLYVLQEALVVVLGTAFLFLLIWLTLIIFLLLWRGGSFLLLSLTWLVGLITSVRDRPLALNGPELPIPTPLSATASETSRHRPALPCDFNQFVL